MPGPTDNKQRPAGNSPDTRPMIKLGDQPAIIDTSKGVENDPRGDNKPGVIPDLPLEDDKDPVTNLYKEQVDQESGLPAATSIAASNQPLNLPEADKPASQRETDDAKPTGRMVEMVADRDYWPRTRPKDWPNDQEYRVRAGETFRVPQSEAEDLMEAGTARRARR